MRLFVGVWPSDDVADAVAALRRPNDPTVRWSGEDQWHVTLRFLGEVTSTEDVVTDLTDVAARIGPRDATFGPATARLGRGILMVPVAGVDDLAAAVGADDFTGHLTVARSRSRDTQVPARLAGEPITATMRVEEFALIRSHLGNGPARYETLHTFRLTGAFAP